MKIVYNEAKKEPIMEQEKFISGYCKALDQSRTVLVEYTEGELYADCSYGSCPFEAACPIAESIRNGL